MARPSRSRRERKARLRATRFDAAAFARCTTAGEGWWEVLVMLQSSLPTVIFDTGFTDRQPEHLPKLACRAVARNGLECMWALLPAFATLRRGSLALRQVSSEGW